MANTEHVEILKQLVKDFLSGVSRSPELRILCTRLGVNQYAAAALPISPA